MEFRIYFNPKKAISNSTGPKKKRFERQTKAIEKLIIKVKKGGQINPDDIPSPPAGIGLNKAPEQPQETGDVKLAENVEDPVPEKEAEKQAKIRPPIPPRAAEKTPPVPDRVPVPVPQVNF